MTEGRHETTDGSITAPCACGERHDLSFVLGAATRLAIAEAGLDVERLARALSVLGIPWKDDPDRHMYDAGRIARTYARLAALPPAAGATDTVVEGVRNVDVVRCRHCGREITNKVDALSPMANPGEWVHWGVDGFTWRGCRAASKTDVMPYWDDSLDRRWMAEPPKDAPSQT